MLSRLQKTAEDFEWECCCLHTSALRWMDGHSPFLVSETGRGQLWCHHQWILLSQSSLWSSTECSGSSELQQHITHLSFSFPVSDTVSFDPHPHGAVITKALHLKLSTFVWFWNYIWIIKSLGNARLKEFSSNPRSKTMRGPWGNSTCSCCERGISAFHFQPVVLAETL